MLVRNSIGNRTLKIHERGPDIEELTLRTETKRKTINLISLYGKLEGCEIKENIKK